MPLTRFVKTTEQQEALQRVFAAPAFLDIRSLAVTFVSDPGVIAEILPPPLGPASTPRVSVSISEIRRSNCVGPFYGCSFNIACRYADEDGFYCLTMPMSTDTAVIFGRELYAEPKKLAEIALDVRDDGRVHGTVTRHGITFIDLRGTFEEPALASGRETTTHHYYFKYLPAAGGCGFAHDPELVRVTHRAVTHQLARGSGIVTFRESPHDPVIDVPVLSVTGATLSESETHTSAEVVATVPAGMFRPYAFGKMDDLTVWAETKSLAHA